jgi:hypothetical protein
LWKRSFETLPDETFKNQEAFRFDFWIAVCLTEKFWGGGGGVQYANKMLSGSHSASIMLKGIIVDEYVNEYEQLISKDRKYVLMKVRTQLGRPRNILYSTYYVVVRQSDNRLWIFSRNRNRSQSSTWTPLQPLLCRSIFQSAKDINEI